MARYIGVILLAALVLWAGEARGECAWVLWEQTTHGMGGEAWTEWNARGFSMSKECEAILKRVFAELSGKPGWRISGDLLEYRSETVIRITRLTCLPDTIDPRGPKGAK